jgi:hypothetical protein
MKSGRKLVRVALMGIAAAALLSCSSEFTQSASPVELIATNTQNLQIIDLLGNPAGNNNCDQDVGSIAIQAILKAPDQNVDQRFNDVRITRYRVSYQRTDGGTAVPAPFVRSIDVLVSGGGSATLSKFLILTPEAITQAPFVALLPQNGGRDPVTGRRNIKMDVVVELFGQTLAGTNVSTSTHMALDFCYDCGGCS